MIGSSQSRVAMLEQGRPDVSLALTCRALFAVGLGRRELGKMIILKRELDRSIHLGFIQLI